MEDKEKKKINFVEAIFKKSRAETQADAGKISSLLDSVNPLKDDRIKKVSLEPAISDRQLEITQRMPFGVDIGSSFIKVAQFAKTTSGVYQLVDLEVVDIPVQSRETTALDRKDAISRALKNMLGNKNPKEAFLSISNEMAELKMMRFPPMPYNEINEAIDWELKQAYQDKVQEYAIDCLMLNEAQERVSEIEVLIVKVNKKDIQNQCNLVKEIGLKPLSVEVDSLAVTSALGYAGQLKDEVVVLLDIGYDVATFSVVYKGKLYFSRNLTISGLTITNAIASYCNVDYNTAENLKLNHGLASSTPEGLKIRNAILPQIESVVSDIELSFKYFSYQLTQSKVTSYNKVIISGGGANFKGLLEHLKSRLGVEIEAANPLKGLNILPEIQKNFNLEKLAPSLSACIGLAIREIEGAR